MLLVAIVTGAWADDTFEYYVYKVNSTDKKSTTVNTSDYFTVTGASAADSPEGGLSPATFKNANGDDITPTGQVKFNSSGKIEFTVTAGRTATVTVITYSRNNTEGAQIKLDNTNGVAGPTTTYTGWTDTFEKVSDGNHTIARAGNKELMVAYVKVVETGEAAQTYNVSYSTEYGTAPDNVTSASVNLPTLSADFHSNTGWVADQDVTVDDETVTAGTTIACGKLVYLTANTTFTAQWEDSDFPYITGVTLPAAPSETFNLSTQTTFNPTDGYVVQKMQTLRNGSYSWMSVNQGGSASSQKWTAPEGSVFISESTAESVTALMATKKNYAIQFTGTTEIQALMNSRNNSYSVHALLVDRTNKTYTIEDISSTTGDSSDPELTTANIATFSNLDPSHTYVVFFYGYNDSGNGLVYEVAFKAPSETVRTNAGKWASYTPSFNVTLEDGAEAYYITSIGAGGQLDGEAVTTLKAGEGYFVKGAEASHTYTATYSTADADATDGNMLVGCTESTTLAAGYTPYRYFLGTDSSTGKAGLFYVYSNAITIPAGKCYLQTEASEPLSLSLPFEEVTAINIVNANDNANSVAPVKVIKNGKLYIGNYNVAGQQVK